MYRIKLRDAPQVFDFLIAEPQAADFLANGEVVAGRTLSGFSTRLAWP